MNDTEQAIERAWRELADACTEHDCDHERRAIDELVRLGQIPPPRRASS